MCLWLVRGYLLVTRILFICTWGTQESHVGICTDIGIMLSWRFLCNFVDMSCGLYWMLCVQVVTNGELKGYIQGAGCPHHYLLCRPLYALGLDACFYRDKLKWNEAYPHKLVAAWMRILLTFLLAMSLEC
jgi:hypothetical protein